MVVSKRVIAVVGLSLGGLMALVGRTSAQQPAPDAGVRKANTQTAATATAAPTTPIPPTIGSVDMSAVFKGYDRVKVNSEEFKSAVMAKKGELVKFQSEAEQEAQMLAKLTPGTADFKKHEDRISELKARHEASREQYEREFTLREAEMLATLYKEVQSMVGRVAKARQMTYIVRVSNDPIVGSNPNSAMMAIERTIVYADPRNDITGDVVHHLNREYHAAGGPTPKPAAATSGLPQPGMPGPPAGRAPGN